MHSSESKQKALLSTVLYPEWLKYGKEDLKFTADIVTLHGT